MLIWTLIPKEQKFFEMFSRAAKNAVETARTYRELVHDYRVDHPNIQKIRDLEHEGDIILARNALWPEGWFALITGYLEAREDPKAAVEREVKEELNLDTIATNLIGNYIFERKNEVMLCYHVVTTGEVVEP